MPLQIMYVAKFLSDLILAHIFLCPPLYLMSPSRIIHLTLLLQLLTSPPTPSHPHDHLTGTLSPNHPIVTPTYKRDTLIELARTHSIPLSQTLAVGDGSNDLLMLGEAGLGVAWRAKPRVQREAPQRLNGDSLTDLLFLLGPGVGQLRNSD